jgi:hypothetical protein
MSVPPRSKTRAALNAWLEQADRTLAEQREVLLSPSQSLGQWDDHGSEVTMTAAEIERSLGDLLRRYVEAPGRWIIIMREPDVPGYYVQFICYEDGALLAEAVSNHFLPEHLRLNKTQEAKLKYFGWKPPSPPEFPNWVTVHPTLDPPTRAVAARAVKTLRQVFGLSTDSPVVMKVFTSAIRREGPLTEPDEPRLEGGTPRATPVPLGGEAQLHDQIPDGFPTLANGDLDLETLKREIDIDVIAEMGQVWFDRYGKQAWENALVLFGIKADYVEPVPGTDEPDRF